MPEADRPHRSVDAMAEEVYAELRRVAAAYLRRERPGQTLQPTALVNEAYVRLAGQHPRFQNRAHFCAIAANAMRQILVERARARHAQKRGGGAARVTLEDNMAVSPEAAIDLTALDEALTRLAALDPRQARIVELRFFGGLSVEEAAESLGVSSATLKRQWAIARAWLARELGPLA
jgi:RNA polymerase sigma-70 factor (ECF subfamily)